MTLARRLWAPLAIAVVLIALALDVSNRYEPIGIDFHTYLAAARVGVQHGWSLLYDQGLVAIEQKRLAPDQIAQPFLSPPTVAWLVTPLVPLPYWVAYWLWAAITLVAFALAVLWAARRRDLASLIAVAAALAPWWVIHAVNLGQVAPLIAVGAVVSLRFARERRDVAAGLALSLVYLKPNTAFLIPIALLVAGRYKTFATWAAVGALLALVGLVTMGTGGLSMYISQLTGTLPSGAGYLTLEGAFGVSGLAATGLRVAIVAATLVAAFRLRNSPGLVIAAGTLGSLLAVQYLHGSDLCLLSVAAWAVWEERPAWLWRVPLAVGWLIASPYVDRSMFKLGLNRYPLLELALFAALLLLPLTRGDRGVTLSSEPALESGS